MPSLLFDVYYHWYDRFMRTFKLDNHQEIVHRVDTFACKRSLNIVDIGGGTGVLAHELIERGHQVTIIDPAKKMTSLAQARDPKIMVINKILGETSPSPTYDVIVLKDCFHHIPDQARALNQISGILKDGGLLLIQDFSPSCFQSQLLFWLERCCLEKVSPIDPVKLRNMLTKINFTITIDHMNKRDYLVSGFKNTKENP